MRFRCTVEMTQPLTRRTDQSSVNLVPPPPDLYGWSEAQAVIIPPQRTHQGQLVPVERHMGWFKDLHVPGTCEGKMFGDFILLWLLMTSMLTVYIHLPYVSLILCKKLNIGHTFFVIFIYQLRDLEVSFVQRQSHWERSEVMIVSMEFVIVGRIVSQCQIHRDSLQSRLLGYVKRNRIWSAFIRALY